MRAFNPSFSPTSFIYDIHQYGCISKQCYPLFSVWQVKRNFLSSRTIVLPVEFLRIPSHFRQEEELLKAANFYWLLLGKRALSKVRFCLFETHWERNCCMKSKVLEFRQSYGSTRANRTMVTSWKENTEWSMVLHAPLGTNVDINQWL